MPKIQKKSVSNPYSITKDHRPDRITTMIRTAELWAKRSTCLKGQNAAIIARNGRIVSVGYNGSPQGHEHCTEAGCIIGPDTGCIRTIHAESNAIAWAARDGLHTEGASIFCTSFPCYTCSKLIIAAGIKEVYYLNNYRIMDGRELFAKSNIKSHRVEIKQDGTVNLHG